MNIIIYARKKNFDTQKAERFFRERRIPYQFLDLSKHRMGQKELLLFARKLGVLNLMDRKNPEALSHPAAHTDDTAYILETLLTHPHFLVSPIVRNGDEVTLGADEAAWNAWIRKG